MSNDPVAHAVAGAGGGALAAVVTYPLITLSTRAQTAARHEKTGNLEAIRRVLEKDGVRGLYAGLESALYGMTLTNFVYYYFYEGIKGRYLEAAVNGAGLTTLQSMTAGTYAGVATSVVTNPIWVVNTRMMVDQGRSTLETVQDIVRHDGIGGFFSGVGPALLLVVNPVLNYTVYEQLTLAVGRRRASSPLDAFVIGALSKIVATTLTYPLITLKSRLQLRQDPARKAAATRPSLRELYSGWSLKVLQSALQSAFLFFFKEQLFALALAIVGLARRLAARRF